MSDTAIRVSNLSKMFKIYNRPSDLFWELVANKPRYKPFWALREISFEVKRGQVVGLIGRNGAGKSTLLKIITGTLDSTEGEVTVAGRISSILELGTGFNYEYTGRENAFLGGLIVGLSRDEITDKMDWIIDFSELEEFIDQPFRTYSSGMQARLTFSTAICIDPDILIIDEALAVGDARFSRKCFRKIEEFRQANRTILFVSHDVNTISTFCNHAILLEKGRIFDQGEPHRIGKVYYQMLFATGEENCAIAVPEELTTDNGGDGATERDPEEHEPAVVATEFPLEAASIIQETGFAWWVNLSNMNMEGDNAENPERSVFVLYEDGIALGPAHSAHERIRRLGLGCFSHWGNQLYFSTSDNSDPGTNGRKYCLRHKDALSDVHDPNPALIADDVNLHEMQDNQVLRQQALRILGLARAFDQDSTHAMRMGNKKAEILDFGILDESGQRTTLLISGQNYILFFRTLFYEDVQGATSGFVIRNMKGVDLFGTSTYVQGLQTFQAKRGTLMESRCAVTMWLTNDIYFLTVAIADPFAKTDVQYDMRYDALQFEVQRKNTIFTTSIVDLDEKPIERAVIFGEASYDAAGNGGVFCP